MFESNLRKTLLHTNTFETEQSTVPRWNSTGHVQNTARNEETRQTAEQFRDTQSDPWPHLVTGGEGGVTVPRQEPLLLS